MSYKHNPKTKGSGIICAIPQKGICPNKCPDCFFQGGRSYLEPLDLNLPNIPEFEDREGRVIRINDGNDSNMNRDLVIEATHGYTDKFYNTAIPYKLESFPGPVVLTINPGEMTDKEFHKLDAIPTNLMFVRLRANGWNIDILKEAVNYYTDKAIPRSTPIIVTFMAYYTETVPEECKKFYTFRKRTMNSYWVITQEGWDTILEPYKNNPYVYSCGKDANTFSCQHCGNCIREYYNTKERLRGE